MKYQNLRDATPNSVREACIITWCPQIYEACLIFHCSSIHADEKKPDVYLIVGKAVDPKEAGLEKKVGKGDALIEVPRELIDKIRK